MSSQQYRDRIYALEVMGQAERIDPHAVLYAQFSLAGLDAKDAGLTAEGLTEEMADPNSRYAQKIPLMVMAISAPITDLARAAIRLADEHPELIDLPARDARSIARTYLPTEGATA